MVGNEEALSHREGLNWIGINGKRPVFVLGGSRYCDMSPCKFDNFVSQAHQHILNAEIAGEASPGKTTHRGTCLPACLLSGKSKDCSLKK